MGLSPNIKRRNKDMRRIISSWWNKRRSFRRKWKWRPSSLRKN